MDYITPDSPKRLIVADFVHTEAQRLFGDKYIYRLCAGSHDPLEKLVKLGKPMWNTILGDESSVIYDLDGTLENEVLMNVAVTAKVESSDLLHAEPLLQDVETMKNVLIAKNYEHKENMIYGDVTNKDYPAFSAGHAITYTFGVPILHIQWAILLKIFTESNNA